MKRDLLSVVEAAYRLEAAPLEWLRDVGTAAHEQIGAGLGMLAFFYEINPQGRIVVGETWHTGMPDGFEAPLREGLGQMPPEFVRESFARCEAVTASQGADAPTRAYVRPMLDAAEAAFGWRDAFMLGGMDPTGQGVYLGAWLPRRRRLDPRTRATWSRIAVHVASANRLRRRIAAPASADAARADPADAVLTPGGRVAHAQGEAALPAAREVLSDAVRAVERARGRTRRSAPEQAVEAWKGLVSARWSVVDHFEADGRRYVLARRNEARVAGLDALTSRERQAVGYAALGHGNKLIAYEMGISPSTAGVLLHRAARKLGAATREELLARYERAPRVQPT